MYVLIALGIIFFIFSLLLFFAPGAIRRLNALGHKASLGGEKKVAEEKLLRFRIILGILFLVIAWSMYYFAFIKQVTP